MIGRKKRSPQSVSGFLDPTLVKEVSPILSVPCSGFPAGVLPNPRLVSSTFHPHQDIPDGIATHMVAIMGQFLDHDITFTPEEEAEGCCCGSTEEACFPIKVNRNDPFFNRHKVGCLDFTRSMAFCEHFRRQHREQINGITAFVDASNVYGSTKARADSLRTLSDGLMKISTEGIYEMLPIINGSYHAGDTRAMENPALASMHTLFLREHNRIAEQLHNMEPHLDDEEIYQRTRRIVSAEMQNVVYGEEGYLSIVLGPVAMAQYDLVVSPNPSTYNPDQDPSISNVFATAAYRFGHSMIQGVVNMVNEATRALESEYALQDNFFSPAHYLSFNGAGMEKILGGLVNQQAQTSDRFVINDVTNHLFPEHGASFGSDLVARNIQRGRDHGLASYMAYREFCGLEPFCKWSQKPADISSANWDILMRLYKNPHDIDVFVGGLAERPSQDGLTGHTFQCIKSKQFQFLKYGDRYFFTHANQAGSFKPYQISNLLQRTLGDIICDNTRIESVRKNVFLVESPLKRCTDRNQLEIELFKGL
ncbi:chorion peroxidase-like [Tigriopus californicus]|uniref:chorion peroxidase-like n=1 Tax=Tigriopus californicus TaxID=6832 RepID=UPI0027DA1450|nr:chorion peroxidase-like [Tigriopus californicus]